MYELIIIGAGPAGMSAALYASRQNLNFLLIGEVLGGLANLVPTLKTYLGFSYLTGYQLIERFKKHLSEYKIPIKNEKVLEIKKSSSTFAIKTKNSKYETKAIIIASGRRFKHLNIPGEEKFKARGVSDCTACDGPLFKGKTVAVIGGGRTGVYATLYLLKLAKKIYLIEKEEKIKTEGGLKRFADIIQSNKKVEILLNTYPAKIRGDKFVKDMLLKNNGKTKILPVDGIFVEIGYTPNTEFVRRMIKLNELGEIMIDAECKTNIEGIFAAGDVTNLREKQVAVSVGEGAKAALSCVTYLERTAKKS